MKHTPQSPAPKPVTMPIDRGPLNRPDAQTKPGTHEPAEKRADRPAGESSEDGPLESLGKAVSAPVRGAADDDQPAQPAQDAPSRNATRR